jgi:hypothetical protein
MVSVRNPSAPADLSNAKGGSAPRVSVIPAQTDPIENGIQTILGAVNPVHIPIGVETWAPVFQFHLFPDGNATYTLGGKNSLYWSPAATEFQNSP